MSSDFLSPLRTTNIESITYRQR